nr:MAG TPA: hypothetical protein [Caudoviricetes sp.]
MSPSTFIPSVSRYFFRGVDYLLISNSTTKLEILGTSR